ncbi:MAG TPA: Uma2 family endonuclease [Hyphomicrobiaceae bacterium]|nr:Uma2 family endonuclease [Hyphomicrobiaceae bacterium]
MSQHPYGGMREGTARQSELTGLPDRIADLIASAPTEPEAFLDWSEQRQREDGKFELSRGRVVCNMIHASRYHSRVLRNLIGQLDRLLDPDRFDIGVSDFAVRTPYGIRSPDVVVDEARPERGRITTTPIFIAEVLSPTTEKVDFTEKLEEYTAIETLQTYLICSQDEPRAWAWARQGDGSWLSQPTVIVGREGAIAPAGLGIELTMAAIFRGIPDASSAE